LRVVVKDAVSRGDGTHLFFGYASQAGQESFHVAFKYVGHSGFLQEALMHQAAAQLAPEGVLPLLAWTDDSSAIQALKLPGLPTTKSQLDLLGGGVLLMPLGKDWEYPSNNPLEFLHRVVREVCPTLQMLAENSLYHNDLKMGNIVEWQGRLHLIDFGYASWGQNSTNRKVLVCGKHYTQAPELGNPSYAGRIGEPQLVFTLGSLVLEAVTADFDDCFWFERQSVPATELNLAFSQLEVQVNRQPELLPPGGWNHGFSPVVKLLSQLLAANPAHRPSIQDSVAMLEQVWHDWRMLKWDEEKECAARLRGAVPQRAPELAADTSGVLSSRSTGAGVCVPNQDTSRFPLASLNYG
jgi:hypothetical protein